jgi:hypothetical protein
MAERERSRESGEDAKRRGADLRFLAATLRSGAISCDSTGHPVLLGAIIIRGVSRSDWKVVVASHAKALTGGFQRARQIGRTYNDRAEQVMVDVRYWHIADYFSRPAECLLSGVKRTLFHAAPHVR